MIQPQLAHELYASVYLVRLELEEVEPAAELIGLSGKVDEFGQRATDLVRSQKAQQSHQN